MVTFRSLSPSDAQDILLLESQVRSLNWSTLQVIEEFKKDNVINLGAFDGSRLVGYLFSNIVGDDLEILSIAVDSDYRRSKIGEGLLKALLENVGEKKNYKIFLEVRESNVPAINFYKNLGFNQIDIRKNYYQTPENTESALVFQLAVD